MDINKPITRTEAILSGEEPYPYSVAFASVDIEGNPPSLTVSRYSASSPTENLYIATQ